MQGKTGALTSWGIKGCLKLLRKEKLSTYIHYLKVFNDINRKTKIITSLNLRRERVRGGSGKLAETSPLIWKGIKR